MSAVESDDVNASTNQGEDDPNILHLFLKENSRRKPLVIMQVLVYRFDSKVNIYLFSVV